ncbi:hypothetical protein PLICRDRAFT_45868 [Plicaturopsis crispa FD-325 SS-3]|uniref:Uncharacterized protein n=1 Tax=Plicaturopsis crispa FD-325 SS-3 TaxID=944288 RepID=A0A0C9SKY0_PLICR|nr:hypothetical protein PLICRDRAFT_45868 [Plicaturopsis crispa FD-325 SS-3]
MAKRPKDEPRDDPLPPLPKPPVKSDAELREEATAREAAKAKAFKSLLDIRRASAWQVHRWPIDKRIANSRTRIHLPRTYLARIGVDIKPVREGVDLNQVVYRHYAEQAEEKAGEEWVNYVHADRVVSRRHEYLGPDPRVAGYFFDIDGDVHIQWYDGFLHDQWMDKQKWKLELTQDATGKWIVKEDAD